MKHVSKSFFCLRLVSIILNYLEKIAATKNVKGVDSGGSNHDAAEAFPIIDFEDFAGVTNQFCWCEREKT